MHAWEGSTLTQETVGSALGSGEAEFLSVWKGAAMLLGAGAMVKDLGIDLNLIMETDSSAPIGTAGKAGLQKTKHIGVK